MNRILKMKLTLQKKTQENKFLTLQKKLASEA